jgi:hypothetical protein
MKNITDKKSSEAGKVSKGQIIDKVKSENSEKYDQMLIDSEIIRNDIYYINYKASYVNLIPKKAIFAMLSHVKIYFDDTCCGGSSQHGDICEVEKDFIKSIISSDCNIENIEYVGSYKPSRFKNNSTYQFLRKGLTNWNDPNEKDETTKSETKSSLLDNIKNTAGTISSAVKSIDDKVHNIGDTVQDFGDKLENSLKWLNDGGGRSESEEYSSLKLNYFNKLKFEYNGTKIYETQPTYFIPNLTYSKPCSECNGEKYVDCEKCNAKHEYECPTCRGKGRLKCKGYVGRGSGGDGTFSNADYACDNGRAKCDSCDGSGYLNGQRCSRRCSSGWITCPTCKGVGDVNCELKYASNYGIGKLYDLTTGKTFCKGKGLITCDTCYGDHIDNRYGKVDCKPCKATGEIGEIVYIEIEVGTTSGEFYKYSNEIIEYIQKKPDTLFKYLNKSNIKTQIVYTDINGFLNENYDSNSDEFCKNIENSVRLKKKDEYPRIISEEIYYDVIPFSTLEYNHILSGTIHKFSAVHDKENFDILFHTNPVSVKKFDIINLFKAAGWNFKKAFSTKSYKEKLDKKNELLLLFRVAKVDGQIEDSEKRVLSELITDLKEFSSKEKVELFNLFSMKELPPLTEEETVFSSNDRAEIAIQNLNKMMKEDLEIEAPEILLISSIKDKIYSNIGKYPGFAVSFFKTWQVSLPIIISLISVIGITIYITAFDNKLFTNENNDAEAQKTISDTITNIVEEAAITKNDSVAEESQDTSTISIQENPPFSENYDVIIGEWEGEFGTNKILLVIESINEDGSVAGYNIVANNKRALSGYKNGADFELKEPGDDEWDGVFKFTLIDNTAIGTWTSNNGEISREFKLIKK